MKQPVRLCLTECIQTKVIDLPNTLPCPNKQTIVTIEDFATEHSQTRRKKNKTKVIIKHLAMSKHQKWLSNTLPQSAASCRAVPRAVRTLMSSPTRSSSSTTLRYWLGNLDLETKNFIIRRQKNVAPGVPVPAGQVQGGVRVDHRPVRRVLPHLGGVDNQYPGDVQKKSS